MTLFDSIQMEERFIQSFENIAESVKAIAAQGNSQSFNVHNTEGEIVATVDNSVTETELAGILYRTAGYKSADRDWSSRTVARELLKEYNIERKS